MSKHKEARSARNKRNGVWSRQRERTAGNKLRACEKHVQRHPNDSFGKAQLERRKRGEV